LNCPHTFAKLIGFHFILAKVAINPSTQSLNNNQLAEGVGKNQNLGVRVSIGNFFTKLEPSSGVVPKVEIDDQYIGAMLVDSIKNRFICGGFGNHGHARISFKDAAQPNSRDHVSIGDYDSGFGQRRAPPKRHIWARFDLNFVVHNRHATPKPILLARWSTIRLMCLRLVHANRFQSVINAGVISQSMVGKGAGS